MPDWMPYDPQEGMWRSGASDTILLLILCLIFPPPPYPKQGVSNFMMIGWVLLRPSMKGLGSK